MKENLQYTILVRKYVFLVSKEGVLLKPKLILKMTIDLVMTVLLFCQMAYMLIGETAHEWMGSRHVCSIPTAPYPQLALVS